MSYDLPPEEHYAGILATRDALNRQHKGLMALPETFFAALFDGHQLVAVFFDRQAFDDFAEEVNEEYQAEAITLIEVADYDRNLLRRVEYFG